MMTAGKRARRILTSRVAVSASSFLASGLIRAVFRSVNVRFVVDDPASIPHREGSAGIFIFWHEMMLLPAYTHSRRVVTLVSQSQDGELIAQAYRRLGGEVVRGSAARGRLSAFREVCRLAADRNVGIAADGPRGPARKVPIGVIRAAGFTGRPIIPAGIAYEKCFRIGPPHARIALPWVGSRAWMVIGRPIFVPTAARALRPLHWFRVQAAMNEVQGRAERLASGLAKAGKTLSLKEMLAGDAAS